MNSFIRKIKSVPDFETEKFFKGYYLSKKKLNSDIYLIEMEYGHKFYQKEKVSTHIYYILEGSGLACIDGNRYNIEKGDIIEIPVDTEFAFKGKMKMIEIMDPPFEPSTHIDTRKNDL